MMGRSTTPSGFPWRIHGQQYQAMVRVRYRKWLLRHGVDAITVASMRTLAQLRWFAIEWAHLTHVEIQEKP